MKDVIIVGAGLAGLNAAHRLKKAGLSVMVIEARDRVGGRNFAHHLADGNILEMGGQWIGPTQTRMYELCEELGLETFPTYNEGKVLVYNDGKKSLMGSDKDALPKLNVFALLSLGRAMKKVEQLQEGLDLEKPWNHPNAEYLDGESLESWVRKHVRFKAAKDYFRLVSEAVFSTEAKDMSMLHFLFYLKSGGGIESLLNTDEGAQEDRIKGGTQQISIKLAERLGKDVVLNCPVHRIEQSENSIKIYSGIQVWEGKKGIVALPPTLAGRISYNPPLPGVRDQLTQRIPAGSVIKIQVVYESPFWRKLDLNGQVASFTGPVKVVLDNSLHNDSRGVLVMFMEANKGRQASEWTAKEREAKTIDSLVNFFGEEAKGYVEYIEKDWMNEEFTRGCYGGHFTPGVWTAFGKHLRKPIDHIHWAGSETSSVWNGYMEGAVRSGERAADEIIRLLKELI
tara:strand:+ start:5171 stop:6532 length:1362 start_codon:yes stop_codon:yes gene_type:complete